MRSTFIAALALSGLTSCASMTAPVIGTESTNAVCIEVGHALPTRSRSDTEQTRSEITTLYARFAAACPQHKHLIPK